MYDAVGIAYGRRYQLRLLDIKDLFRIRDSIEILKAYGLQDNKLVADVYAEIERRTND